jgi:hypothetical protein
MESYRLQMQRSHAYLGNKQHEQDIIRTQMYKLVGMDKNGKAISHHKNSSVACINVKFDVHSRSKKKRNEAKTMRIYVLTEMVLQLLCFYKTQLTILPRDADFICLLLARNT